MPDGTVKPARRPSLNPLEHLFAKQRLEGVITETGSVTPTMKRIRIAADGLGGAAIPPGRHLRIQINDPLSLYGILRPGETLRTYSVWDQSDDGREVEIRAHLYDGEGIGLRWVRDVEVGHEVSFWGPLGDFDLKPDAPYHVFIGEETATAAFGPMIRALGSDAHVYGVLESETPDDEVPVPGPHVLRRVHRKGASAVSSQTLLGAVSDLGLPEEVGMAYVAGEARTCQAVRDHLVHVRKWPRTQIKVKPFWTPGKKGLHH